MFKENKSINGQLKELLNNYADEFTAACHNSREDYIKSLPVGQAIPSEGHIYGEDNRSRFEEACREKRQIADSILSKEIDEAKAKLAEAPSSDAVNTISLLKLRSDIKAEEIDNLLDQYGDNEQARKAICSIAHDHDIHTAKVLTPSPIEQRLEGLNNLQHYFTSSMSLHKAEQNELWKYKGSTIFAEIQIDSLFPEDE